MNGLEIIFFGLIATIAASSVVWWCGYLMIQRGRPPVGGVETWISPVFSDVAARRRVAFICSTNPIKRPTIGAEAAG